MADDYVYELSRIGPAATCPKVPDVMRLLFLRNKITFTVRYWLHHIY